MAGLCSNHVFKMSLKQQPVAEVCPDLNEEGMMFFSFKIFSKCETFLWEYSNLKRHFKLVSLNLSLENIFLYLHVLLLQQSL